MRYRLRTLLIVLAIAPPLLAIAWFVVPVIVNNPAFLLLPTLALLTALSLWVIVGINR